MLDIENIAFRIFGYDLSYLELFGWITGTIAVALSARANLWSWPLGLVNVTLSFFLFYQVQLYPDMFLQIFYFITNILGWWRWANPKKEEEDRKKQLKISFMTTKELLVAGVIGLTGTFLLATFASRLHEWIPSVFSKPSAAPFLDSFITVMSILATFYMIQKKVESWVIWLLVDIVCTYLYFVRNIKLYSFLYLIFCGIAIYAIWNWVREYRSYKTTTG